VQSLASGEHVKVRPMGQKTVEGDVAAVTDTALTVTRKGRSTTIDRSAIREVKVKSAKVKQRNQLVSAAIGGTGGVVAGVIADGALTDGNGVSGSATVLFAAIGFAAGFVISSLRPAYRTIYKVE
jgi:hypothetical protein